MGCHGRARRAQVSPFYADNESAVWHRYTAQVPLRAFRRKCGCAAARRRMQRPRSCRRDRCFCRRRRGYRVRGRAEDYGYV